VLELIKKIINIWMPKYGCGVHVTQCISATVVCCAGKLASNIDSHIKERGNKMQHFFKGKCSTLLFVLLLLVATVVATGCKGSDGSTGPQGPAGVNGTDGTNGSNGTNGTNGLNGADTVNINSLNADEMIATTMTGSITSVTMSAQPVVKFTVVDQNGRGVTGLGAASTSNAANLNYVRVAVAYLSTDPTDTTTNAWHNYYVDSSAQALPTNEGLSAGLVDNGDGSYTYTFQNAISDTIDMTATHRVAVQISGNVPGVTPTLPITHPANIIYTFVPDGSPVTNTRDIVSETACNGCHTKLGNTSLDFNGGRFAPGQPGHGGRQVTQYCVMCHNPQMESAGRTVSTADASGNLINPDHDSKAPNGSTWLLSNGTATYAQMEFVTMIHKTHMGENLQLQGYGINDGHFFPNDIGYPQDIRNCTTCHIGPDGDNYKNKPSIKACGSCHDNISWASTVPTGFLAHAGGAQSDTQCALCHDAANIASYHDTTRTNTDPVTGASMPVSTATYTCVISSASVSTNGEMSVVFKIQQNGSDVVLNTFSAGSTNMISGLSTSKGPDFIAAYAVQQDGISNPSDWNSGHTSAYLQNIWDGTKGSLTGPDGNGYYTAVISGSTFSIPSNAKMVTAIMKDSPTIIASGTPALTVPAMKTADGYTGRRAIVDASKCDSCHKQLGTSPNFHGGNYSITICAACHIPNQTSNGWSASFRTWVHGIHGASKRSVPFTWHATAVDDNFSMLLYPAILNDCQKCHLPGTYDFSASQYTPSLISGMLNVTVSKGTYTTGPSGSTPAALNAFRNSPYIVADGVTDYGTGPSVDAGGNLTPGDPTNLVQSPITAVCVACHDLTTDINHMEANGGQFYETRATAPSPSIESCLVCHGHGAMMDIDVVHKVN
jgi:OmcA/MtrC family decaheme c-type cytochrome